MRWRGDWDRGHPARIFADFIGSAGGTPAVPVPPTRSRQLCSDVSKRWTKVNEMALTRDVKQTIADRASGLNRLNCRIEMFELNTGVLGSELPIGF